MQSNLFKNSLPETDELVAYRLAEPALKALAESWYLPEKALTAAFVESGKRLVVKLNGALLCAYKLSGKTKYIEISSDYTRFIPEGTEHKLVTGGAYRRIPLESIEDTAEYTSLLCEIAEAMILAIPKDFSCCHRYEACSDDGKCIHPDREFAMGCYYKRNLKSGQIFYGKNSKG
ncbi:MAG: hypothetical protein GX025_06515 [Clostridiales bacterium]|nr:hypothetical protein [Clostridiales bacterium]